MLPLPFLLSPTIPLHCYFSCLPPFLLPLPSTVSTPIYVMLSWPYELCHLYCTFGDAFASTEQLLHCGSVLVSLCFRLCLWLDPGVLDIHSGPVHYLLLWCYRLLYGLFSMYVVDVLSLLLWLIS